MPKLIVPISGMHCKSCEILVGQNLRKISGVTKVEASAGKGRAVVEYCGEKPSEEVLKKAVQEAGYEIGSDKKLSWISTDWSDYKDLLVAGVIIYFIYLLVGWSGLLDLNVRSGENPSIWIALLVGLVAGISTCMALVGGLVLSLSARHAEMHPEATAGQKFRPHLYFNLGRILGYGILGGLIGLVGSALKPSAGFLGVLTVVVGGVMIFLGLKLIEIFPILRKHTISLPSGIAKLVGLDKEVKEYSHRAAMVTGALTFFLPCGFTQAMQLFAVSTGSFWSGAAIMFLFALGTAPGLLGVGGLSSIFKGRRARIFFMTAGLAVIILGWYNIKNASALFAKGNGDNNNPPVVVNGEKQIVRMTQDFSGYNPNVFTVKVNQPVKWIINSTAPFSCSASIVMPKYKITKQLSQGENVIEFTPTQTGEIPFSCSMGMFRGKFIVVDNEQSLQAPATANLSSAAGSTAASCHSGAGGSPRFAGEASGSGGGCGGGCGGLKQ